MNKNITFESAEVEERYNELVKDHVVRPYYDDNTIINHVDLDDIEKCIVLANEMNSKKVK